MHLRLQFLWSNFIQNALQFLRRKMLKRIIISFFIQIYNFAFFFFFVIASRQIMQCIRCPLW